MHATCARAARPATLFVDGAHVTAPGRLRGLRRELRAAGVRSYVSRRTLFLACLALAPDLQRVVDVLERHRARVVRIELACDLALDQAAALRRVRLRCRPSVVPDRPPGLACAYWGRASRAINAALYVDAESKVATGNLFDLRVAHFELRLRGAALKRRGWNRPTALLDLDREAIADALIEETIGLEEMIRPSRARTRVRA